MVMPAYKTHKKVLSVKNNPAQFLNGITSNDLDKPDNAFLNINGRIVATFDQLKVDDNEMLLCIEESYIESVLDHIAMYVKLAKVEVKEEEHNVYFDLKQNCEIMESDYMIPQKCGQLILTDREIPSDVTEDEFTLFRLKNNIPLHGVDYKDEMLLNVSEDNFVSFTKGCFLGQEPISKVHSRSKPTWKLVAKYEDECNDEEKSKMTSKIIDPDTKKMLGFTFIKNE